MELPTSTDGINMTWEPGYLMVYTLERNDRDGGWLDRRALIDKFYLDPTNGNKKTPYNDQIDGRTVTDVLIDMDGHELPDQSGTPWYIDFELQPSAGFSFLKEFTDVP